MIIYSDDGYPPFSYSVKGKAAGIYPDIVREVANAMPEFEVTIKPIPWRRGLMLLENGQGFALLPPYSFPKKRPYIAPYSQPILAEAVVVYCHQQVSEKLSKPLDWPSSFEGLRIGINSGYGLGGKAFWKMVQDGKIKIREAKDTKANLLMLEARRNDCYLHVDLSVKWVMKQIIVQGELNNASWLVAAMEVDSQQGYLGYTAIAENYPYKQAFIERFNQVLLKQQQNGVVEKIVGTYLN
ncbi:substrate-binding periplasmic protein [Vibrio paucivorans]|uniref:Transporter substrate-binding domain-containing protein n=1 Tax=Vibrio paucivorans TaxID=2829489 RepID=A0A9X3HRM1_9VIBR|nr:transporter substrate-binding domain-containing protein [Vibrio paucivorans]MCW8334046.1 transporter substrate-binding domain-containing protein [Vibrio paucivorans]